MVVYSYDKNFLYTGASVAPVNPKRPTESLAPSSSTEIAPPTGYAVEQIPLFNINEGTWSLVESPYKIAMDEELAYQVEEAEKTAVEAQRNLDEANSNLQNSDGVYLFKELEDGSFYEKTAAELTAETDAKVAYEAKAALNVTMNTNIISKAKEITLGSTPDSMQAFTSAFTLRASNPAEYVAEGLVAHYATTGYALGDALDTVEKITEYYTKIVIELDKFRNAEINIYLAAKALL